MSSPEGGAEPGPELRAAVGQLDLLVESFEQEPDPDVRERVFALLQSVDAVHRPGLRRLAALLDEVGDDRRERALADPAVRLLLELYDLAPSAPPPRTGFVPLEAILDVPALRQEWVPAAELGDLAPDGMLSRMIGETRGLLARVKDQVRAYEDATGANPLPVGLGRRDGDEVVCPWHGCRYDLESGARLDGSGPPLASLPVAVEGGRILVELTIRPPATGAVA